MKDQHAQTWGETISIKFYLNKKLKPVITGKRKLYSLYARIVCKKQVCDYKVTDQRFTQEELDHVLNGRDLEDPRLKHLIFYSQGVIKLIMDAVHTFEREDFILRSFPELIRTFSELDFELHSVHGLEQIRENLERNGYGSLIEIIDWKQKSPDVIASHLGELQQSGKINTFTIWNNYKPGLSLAAALHRLTIGQYKKKYSLTEGQRHQFIQDLIAQKVLHPEAAPAAEDTLQRAVKFANLAMKLTSK